MKKTFYVDNDADECEPDVWADYQRQLRENNQKLEVIINNINEILEELGSVFAD
jgi:hypothetical protein